jgi:hypothetical protein
LSRSLFTPIQHGIHNCIAKLGIGKAFTNQIAVD